jgi:hypothetical protein
LSPSSGSKYKPSDKQATNKYQTELYLLYAYFSTLKMEVTYSSESLVNFQRTTRRYSPEDRLFIIIFARISHPTDGVLEKVG